LVFEALCCIVRKYTPEIFIMTHTIVRSLFLIGVIVGVAAPVYAQQTTAPAAADAPAKPAAAAPAAPAAPPVTTTASTAATAAPKAADDVPSPAVLKKARMAGYYTKVRHGNVVYCKSEAVIGTHFESENCINEDQLEQTLLSTQAQRDSLQHTIGTPSRNP
jgi:hypothetical protein